MSSEKANLSPPVFALKMMKPDGPGKGPIDLRDLFERELRLWLGVPYHFNVVLALRPEFAPLPKELGSEWPVIPIVPMPYYDTSLKQWIDSSSISTLDRLMAVAQVCNGLAWLYRHGITGHGDLKPDNVLVRDLRRDYALSITACPWQVSVSDLGWANIWQVLKNETQRGWAPYVAPERFDGRFEDGASDIFAVGVMGVELLQGTHPAGKRTKDITWSRREWRDWARSGKRDLSRLHHSGIREILESSLATDPAARPTPGQVVDVVAAVVEHDFGIPARAFLLEQNDSAQKFASVKHKPWAAVQVARASGKSLDGSIDELQTTLQNYGDLKTTLAAPQWLATAIALGQLRLCRGTLDDCRLVVEVADQVLRFCVDRFERLDLREAFYGEAGLSFDAYEVVLEVAANAVGQLDQASYGILPPGVAALKQALESKARSAAQNEWDSFLGK